MADDWDESGETAIATNGVNGVDSGLSFQGGRGFRAFNGGDDDFSNDSYERKPGGFRGGGRGGRGGLDRGGRGGRGGHDRGGRGGRGGGDRGGRGGFENRGGDRGDRGPPKENGDHEKPREIYIPPEPTEDEGEMFGANITSGINFAKYDNIVVQVSGENTPKPIQSFSLAGLRSHVLDNIVKSSYKTPTPIQKYALPIIMQGRDLMACAQTGSGKTAAFLLPMINALLADLKDCVVAENGCCQPHAVIISPTRELTIQIYNEARKFAHGSILKTCVAYGGTAVSHQANQLSRGCHILVATPGRLLDFVDRRRISFESVRFVVLDEADRMLDMGFMTSIEKMIDHPSMPPTGNRITLMFSATFPEDIQQLARKFLHQYIFIAVGVVGGACADVEQMVYEVSKYEKKDKLIEILTEGGTKRTLVFVETKRNADFLSVLLSEQKKLPTTSIHGDRLQREREEALADFKRGKCDILVATAVAARGLDIKDVAHVINYDLPKSIDEYVHRIGRTGRVGNRGKATSFYDPQLDNGVASDLARILKQAEQPVPDFLSGAGGFSGGGGGGRNFGGEDVRNFESSHQESAANEQEEAW